jgi:ATP-dependent DNA helicase RecG
MNHAPARPYGPAAKREIEKQRVTRPALDDPVQFLGGVGPQRAEVLATLGVRTAGDLMMYFPFRHEERQERLIRHLEPGDVATVVGRLAYVRVRGGLVRSRRAWPHKAAAMPPGRRTAGVNPAARRHASGTTISATLIDNTGQCRVWWFNAGYVADRIENGGIVRLTGKVTEADGRPRFVNPKVEVLDASAAPADESRPTVFEPVYPATTRMSSQVIARLIRRHLDVLADQIEELYPELYRRERDLPPRRGAVMRMHLPTSQRDLDVARRRLAYDELLLMQIAVQVARRQRRELIEARPLPLTPMIDARIRRRLPFALTAGQDQAVAEIVADLARSRPMNRLLQGDVGCGKTLAAIYAALVAVANGAQVAFMAPTELLAEQLYRNADRYLAGSRVRRALLTGGLNATRRRQFLASISDGELDLVVGTQALLEEDVNFPRLGLVIVDEQHRFGVRQRALIRGKGPAPHYLVMTATPIPRTLAMTVFGDLDVTTIRGLPPGRAPVQTRIILPREADLAWRSVQERLASGEQAFVVYPLIEESENSRLLAATTEYNRLRTQIFSDTSVGLIHGRMPSDEKEQAMSAFARGVTRVLVATTVVEVGIDVPQATVIVIQHANRYGLSQLHQLRGRVGRGGRPGYCLLMADSDADSRNARLDVLTRTTDGFEIAEEDLRLRGPGEMLGTRQHGLPELRVADLLRDHDLLLQAQRDASALLKADPNLHRPEFRALRQTVLNQYGACLDLATTG